MEATQLKRFVDFDAVPARDLDAVAARVRRLRMPAGRWLVRPGRVLSARVFLLEGRVRLLEQHRSVIVGAGSRRARRAVYPGASGVQTLTDAVFLSVDPAALEPLLPVDVGARPGVPELEPGATSWQQQFLTSPLMQRLDPVTWQRVLRSMRAEDHPAGAAIIRAGDAADCCFVLCSGRAQIRTASGAMLAVVRPGALFGEDALVSRRARNATVVMTQAGRVVSLGAHEFQRWLLDAVVSPLQDAGGRPLISVDGVVPEAVLYAPVRRLRDAARTLSRALRYAVVGGSWEERSLATFLLAEQGIDASPVGTD